MKVIAPKIIKDVGVDIPSSKSISNRLLIIRALAQKGKIVDLSEAEDTVVLQEMLEEMPEVMDVGHAGTAYRFLTAYLAITKGDFILTGSDRMKNRPVSPLVDALRNLGASIEYVEKDGFPPLKISGKKLNGGELTIDASISSQFISALMLIGPSLTNGLKINLSGNVVSRSYIDMTAALMTSCAAEITISDSQIEISPSAYELEEIAVEKDWSAISFWYEMVWLGKINHLLLENVRKESIQGDVYCMELFGHFGVESEFDSRGLHLKFHKPIENKLARIVDFTTTPDLVQPFVVGLAANQEQYILAGTGNLKYKETDRGLALKKELKKLGALIDVAPDSILALKGIQNVVADSVEIETYQDHRMAMAFAPLAQIYGSIIIQNPEVVIKSYPKYWEQLEKLGFTYVE